MGEIKERLNFIYKNIEEAKARGENASENVKLIAVSKTKPIEDMLEAYGCGVRDFGENYVQEIVTKYDSISKDARIHMIGHLQTNKVSKIIDKVYMIHSVDSIKLLKEIEKQAVKHDVESMPVLLEVNVAKEESKFGFKTDELNQAITFAGQECPHIEVRGLMTSAPITDDQETNRIHFKELKKMADKYGLPELSMGMTGDYIVAVEEGSTMVRIGTAVFGKRAYAND
ncbi:MAG: YggS family pyridoxal phosphate-dependent enzyme [Eubacteriales bacterium]|nr:YggS family pyridoxal phosphate-dependent enzyme [Eubacteriales bacterium]